MNKKEDTGIIRHAIRPVEMEQTKRKTEKERTSDSKKSLLCRFRAPPIELNENKQGRNYPSLSRVSEHYL